MAVRRGRLSRRILKPFTIACLQRSLTRQVGCHSIVSEYTFVALTRESSVKTHHLNFRKCRLNEDSALPIFLNLSSTGSIHSQTIYGTTCKIMLNDTEQRVMVLDM